MKKILNPYAKLEGYNCFGCSPNNQLGLQMEFYEDGDYVVSDWMPKKHFLTNKKHQKILRQHR